MLMADDRGPKLPWDLILYIVNFVPAAKLYPFLLTSRTVHDTAQRLLHRHINFSNCPNRSIHFIQNILRRPELGRHVITFDLAEAYAEGKVSKTVRRLLRRPDRQITYIVLVELVMQHVKGVESLSTRAVTSSFLERLNDLHSIERFRLQPSFALSSYGELFDKLPLVTHLELPFSFMTISLESIRSDHLPLLEELICPLDVAMKLVPGKSIRKLSLMFPYFWLWEAPPSPYDTLRLISQGTAKITDLSLAVRGGWHESMPELLLAASQVCPDVEELHLAFTFTPGQAVALRGVLQTLPQALEGFRSLHLLDFNGSNGFGVGYFERNRNGLSKIYLSALTTWSEHCPSLLKVVFPNGMIWTLEDGTWKCRSLMSLNRYVAPAYGNPVSGRIRGAESWTGDPTFSRDMVAEWPDSSKWLDR